jgi:hypothetical protein
MQYIAKKVSNDEDARCFILSPKNNDEVHLSAGSYYERMQYAMCFMAPSMFTFVGQKIHLSWFLHNNSQKETSMKRLLFSLIFLVCPLVHGMDEREKVEIRPAGWCR